MTKYSKSEKAEAVKFLRGILKPGDTIYTTLRHVSRSGMSRSISLFKMTDDGPHELDYWACRLLEGFDPKNGGCKASGCGMDMGFHLVNNLSYALFYDYECTGEKCPSNIHVNDWESPRGAGIQHKDGYALRQRWI
jgi:hypothetical protein